MLSFNFFTLAYLIKIIFFQQSERDKVDNHMRAWEFFFSFKFKKEKEIFVKSARN